MSNEKSNELKSYNPDNQDSIGKLPIWLCWLGLVFGVLTWLPGMIIGAVRAGDEKSSATWNNWAFHTWVPFGIAIAFNLWIALALAA